MSLVAIYLEPRSSASIIHSQPVRVPIASMQRAAPAGEARISHEIEMRARGFGSRTLSLPRIVGVQEPALGVVVKVRLHNLIEDLLVHGRVLDWNQCFDAAIEVSRHPIGRRNENRSIG